MMAETTLDGASVVLRPYLVKRKSGPKSLMMFEGIPESGSFPASLTGRRQKSLLVKRSVVKKPGLSVWGRGIANLEASERPDRSNELPEVTCVGGGFYRGTRRISATALSSPV